MDKGTLSALLGLAETRRKIFISYHHSNDQPYYNEFSRLFSDSYASVQDNSLDRLIDSDDPDYVMRRIREKYISGTSCTIVLCGAESPSRKYVDWEIKATLDKQHGLIGVNLPSNPTNANGLVFVPVRLHDNIQSGYGLWIQWTDLNAGPQFLRGCVESANLRSKNLIINDRLLKPRNG
jgi:MTH538 TIR-like domain (DUF1863)